MKLQHLFTMLLVLLALFVGVWLGKELFSPTDFPSVWEQLRVLEDKEVEKSTTLNMTKNELSKNAAKRREREFKEIKKYMVGTLNLMDKNFYYKHVLTNDVDDFMGAEISPEAYVGVLSLAIKRIDIAQAKKVITCFTETEKCDDTFTRKQFVEAKQKLIELYKDSNALHVSHYEELLTFFRTVGLENEIK